MNLKIPDFIDEERKEGEEINSKSRSEQDLNDFWSNHSRTQQTSIKDFLLQEW